MDITLISGIGWGFGIIFNREGVLKMRRALNDYNKQRNTSLNFSIDQNQVGITLNF